MVIADRKRRTIFKLPDNAAKVWSLEAAPKDAGAGLTDLSRKCRAILLRRLTPPARGESQLPFPDDTHH
jgi:hypothetical protein